MGERVMKEGHLQCTDDVLLINISITFGMPLANCMYTSSKLQRIFRLLSHISEKASDVDIMCFLHAFSALPECISGASSKEKKKSSLRGSSEERLWGDDTP